MGNRLSESDRLQWISDTKMWPKSEIWYFKAGAYSVKFCDEQSVWVGRLSFYGFGSFEEDTFVPGGFCLDKFRSSSGLRVTPLFRDVKYTPRHEVLQAVLDIKKRTERFRYAFVCVCILPLDNNAT